MKVEPGGKAPAPKQKFIGRGPLLGEIVEEGDKQYAVIGTAVNKLMAVVLVADAMVDGPAPMYVLPMAKLTFDHESKTWKLPYSRSSIITDIKGLFGRG